MEFWTIIAQVGAILLLFYFYIKQKLSFWARLGVPHPPPNVFTLGINFKRFTHGPEKYIPDLLRDYGKVFGSYILFKPILVVNEATLIKQVLVKDFHLFMDKPDQGTWDDMWNRNLFMSSGDVWKRIRTITSPTFTSGKLKGMQQMMNRCVKMLVEHLDQVANTTGTIDPKEVVTSFTIDVVASTTFATETNSLASSNNPFVQHGIKLFHFKPLKIFSVFLLPLWWNNLLGIRSQFDPEHFDFFGNLVKEIVRQRKEGKGRGKDFVQLLMDAYAYESDLREMNYEKLEADAEGNDNSPTVVETSAQKKSVKNTLTDSEIAAQALIFFVAGFETTSSTITYCLYELTQNAAIQERLNEELQAALAGLDVNSEQYYDTVMNRVPYLDAVIKETLRKYPPLTRLERRFIGEDGYKLGGIPLKKHMTIVISTYGVHHCPDYYPEPDRFNPERFMPENRDSLVPYTFLPFGQGPRNCIGMRFAYQEIKFLLGQLVQRYRFKPATGSTPEALRFKGASLLLTSFPFKINVERREV